MPDKYFLNILTQSRRKFFPLLSCSKKHGLYLAGGTALALQIGHRTSVDFDLYTQKHFRSGTLQRIFRRAVKARDFQVTRDRADTFEANVQPDIHLSCFFYEYPLLESPHQIEGVPVAGLKDIAAMKIIAITQRGTRRDFIDIYYLLQHLTLREILRCTDQKYASFDIYHGLRGLLYFENADHDVALERATVFDRSLTWKKVKESIIRTVHAFHAEIRS